MSRSNQRHLFSGLLILAAIYATPAQASWLAGAFAKIVQSPSYVIVPNVLDNQPRPTEGCDPGPRRHTQAGAGQAPGVRHHGCVQNGRNVVFTVSVPRACETRSCGLIVDQHGATMNAQMQDRGTRLRAYGRDAEHFGAQSPYIVVQPNMTDLSDDASGRLDLESVVGGAYANELPILVGFVRQAIVAWGVDTKRVHFHGFSRGGSTANALHCEASTRDIFASYAVSGAGLGCAPASPTIQINGLADPRVQDADKAVQAFKQQGASSQTIASDPNWQRPKLVFQDMRLDLVGGHEHTRHVLSGLALENVRHSGAYAPTAGHCLPAKGAPSWLVCSATFDMGRKILDFFIQHPKP